MEPPTIAVILGFAPLLFLLFFYRLSPASQSTKVWTTFYLFSFLYYFNFPERSNGAIASTWSNIVEKPVQSGLTALAIGIPLKYIQRKLRFARLNGLRMKYGFTDDPASYEDMTIEQAQEVERNMAEKSTSKISAAMREASAYLMIRNWEFPRLWQFGWISDFFRTSTDPGVSRTINSSGHFINEDKRIEHQRMQATVHLMTGLAAYPVKSHNHSLVVARINEHHHRYGIKINSDDILYLVIHFGLAPVPWINKFGYRKLEPFEVHAIWVLWRELGCRMDVKYIPKTLQQAQEWRKNFEKTFRWREDAHETMALAMLSQVLYPIPTPLKGFVARVFVSIVDWDIVHFCQLEKLRPSLLIREVAHDVFRFCGWLIREFGLPRLNAYQRSPPEAKKDGKMNFGHTPYDTMPFWQERSFWNLWGPRALFARAIGLPMPSAEFISDGVRIEAMGAPHRHAGTQAATERKVVENAVVLEKAPIGFRPAIGFQARRLIGPVDGPTYGSPLNTFPEGTPTTPNSPVRFTREYEQRGRGFTKLDSVDKPEDVLHFDKQEARNASSFGNLPQPAPMVSVAA